MSQTNSRNRGGSASNHSGATPLAASRRSDVSRRAFLRAVGGSAVGALTGCAFKRCEIAKDMPFPDLVAYLNHNIDQIHSWKCDRVKIKVQGAMLMPTLAAKLAIERPRNFRLTASSPVGGNDVVDLGSNDERFWLWNSQDAAVLTARHECLDIAQQSLPMPFEPDWLIETLGVIPLDENEMKFEKHPTDPKRVFLRRKRKSPDGQNVELVSTVDTCQGVIVDHSLTDSAGNMIALARLSEYERDGETGVVLPHTVAMSWPQADMGLELRMGAIMVNPVSISGRQFEMPKIANCPVYDIGEETQQASAKGRSKV